MHLIIPLPKQPFICPAAIIVTLQSSIWFPVGQFPSVIGNLSSPGPYWSSWHPHTSSSPPPLYPPLLFLSASIYLSGLPLCHLPVGTSLHPVIHRFILAINWLSCRGFWLLSAMHSITLFQYFSLSVFQYLCMSVLQYFSITVWRRIGGGEVDQSLTRRISH